jgi:hypothetical protein
MSNYHALELLKTARHKLPETIISNCNTDLLKRISECILKVLNGNIVLTECGKRKLRKYKNLLRSLANKRVSLTRNKVIVQRGGFLMNLLGAVLPALANL